MNVARSSCRNDSQHVDLGDLLLGGAVQRVLDRLAQLVDELRCCPPGTARRARAPRAATTDEPSCSETVATMMKMPSAREHAAVAQRDVGDVADVDAVDEDHARPSRALAEAGALGVDLQRRAVLGAEDVLRPARRRPAASWPWISIRL